MPGEDGQVALCVATFYTELAEKLEAGARAALDEAGIAAIDRFEVPGAFELPVIAKYAAESGRYAAVICLGAVIRGETDHYDYVCGEAARGIQDVQLETACRAGSGCSPSTRWSRRSSACRAAQSETPAPTPSRPRSRHLPSSASSRAGASRAGFAG